MKAGIREVSYALVIWRLNKNKEVESDVVRAAKARKTMGDIFTRKTTAKNVHRMFIEVEKQHSSYTCFLRINCKNELVVISFKT